MAFVGDNSVRFRLLLSHKANQLDAKPAASSARRFRDRENYLAASWPGRGIRYELNRVKHQSKGRAGFYSRETALNLFLSNSVTLLLIGRVNVSTVDHLLTGVSCVHAPA